MGKVSYPEQLVNSWVEQYRRGKTLREIGNASGVAASTVMRRLRDRGEPRRPPAPRRKQPPALVARVAQSGMRQVDVAEVLDTSQPTVSRRLKEARGAAQ